MVAKRISFTFVQFLVFLVIIVILPFLALWVIFSICYRITVKYAAKLFRKDLSKMVTAIGNYLAGEDLYESPKSNIVLLFVLEGNIDCENAKEIIIKKALEPKDGVSIYPELKQYPVKWGGYHFWKTDRNFNLDNHFKIIEDGKVRTEDDVKSLCDESVGKKWVRNKPLWELVIVKNYVPSHSFNSGPHTAIIWRSHHSLGDGYSLLYFFTESLGPNKVVVPRPDSLSRGFFQKLTFCIQFPLKLLWEFSEYLMRISIPYSLSAPKETGSFKTELNTYLSPVIPISKVKDVKRHYGTSFAAVQFAALAGTLQEYNLRRNIPIPDLYPCCITLPHLGHKLYKFRNCMKAALTYLPTGESDPLKRLLHLQGDYNRIKKSPLSATSFFGTSLVGCNVRSVIKWLIGRQYIPLGLSSFPGQSVPIVLLGHKLVDISGWAGPLESQVGIALCLVSYGDGLRLSGSARSSVMTKDDVSEITNLFIQHLEELHAMAAIDEKKGNFEIA